ncbi:MAG TPA: mechanosensitive ion channel family protein [Steroidobacteraceae bacterium]|jgi:small-conductance mechanosensitive channel
MVFADFLEKTYYHNTLWHWFLAAGIAVAVLFLTLIVRRVVRTRYARMLATPQTELLELPLRVASCTAVTFLLVLALFAGAQVLELPKSPAKVLLTLITIAAFWQVGMWATAGVVAWLDHRQRQSLPTDRAAVGSLGIIGFIVRALIWALVLLLTLDNLGINITALVAGLGIGGVAIALAVQNVLGDLLASLSITLDRPFVVGDAVAVGDFSGTVEQIGVKSVRIRSVNGEQIIMSNADLLSSRIRNFGRLRERRVLFNVNLALDAPPERLQNIPAALRALIEAEKDVRFDRSHFARIGNSALEFETVYFVTTSDYVRYMDIQQNINLRIIELLKREKLNLAVPVQKVWQDGSNAPVPAVVQKSN